MDFKTTLQRKDEYIAGLQRNCETLAALCASQNKTTQAFEGSAALVSVLDV